jgi:putative adenylate-forming enzyme
MSKLRILSSYLATRRRRFRSREALEAWQEKQVRRFLKKTLPRSPYTAERFEGRGVEAWREIAPIGKAEMMANFNRLNTVGVDRDEALALAQASEESRDFTPTLGPVTVGLSSGTSGSRGLFIVSPAERARWAGTILAKTLPSSLIFGPKQRIAFFLRANSKLYTSVGSRRVRFEFFDLLTPVDAHLARLNDYAPTLVLAPPSMLLLLAAARARGALRITPGRVFSVAEVLDPLDREHIEAGFEQGIHQIYQATEGFLATTCAQGVLHLNEDALVVQREPIEASGDDPEGRFMPILTDFRRSSQPIIRYRLNDVLVPRAEPCPCGSVCSALDFVEGRADDLFYLPARSAAGHQVVFPDFLRRAIAGAHEAVAAYGVRQVAPDALELYLEIQAGADEGAVRAAVAGALDRLWERLGCAAPSLRPIDRWATGGARKLKRVERAMPAPGDGP